MSLGSFYRYWPLGFTSASGFGESRRPRLVKTPSEIPLGIPYYSTVIKSKKINFKKATLTVVWLTNMHASRDKLQCSTRRRIVHDHIQRTWHMGLGWQGLPLILSSLGKQKPNTGPMGSDQRNPRIRMRLTWSDTVTTHSPGS